MSPTHHRWFSRDARDLSPIGDRSIDLIVTSPPYPMIEMWDETFSTADSRVADSLISGDGPAAFARMHELLDAVWRECARVLRPGGFLCINVGDATRSTGGEFRLYTNHARITRVLESLGFSSLPAIIWRKTTNAPNKFMGSGMLPAGAYVTLEHEYILIFRNGGLRRFTSVAEKEARRKSAFFWEERNRWFVDLWDLPGVRQERGAGPGRQRSGAFPLELPLRLIWMFSLNREIVLDPFAGSGTTLIAAAAAGRSSVGFELADAFSGESHDALIASRSLCREVIESRIHAHVEFAAASDRSGKRLGYRNHFHGFEVKTRQETEIRLEVVRTLQDDTVAREDSRATWAIRAEYGSAELPKRS